MQFYKGLIIVFAAIVLGVTGLVLGKTGLVSAQGSSAIWVYWDMDIKVIKHQPIITKRVTVWEMTPRVNQPPYWERQYFEAFDITCQPIGDVTLKDDHFVFGRGGYLECQDIDLVNVLQRFGLDPIQTQTIKPCTDQEGAYCMQSYQVEIEATVDTTDDDGLYPIFAYPQQIGKKSTNYLAFNTEVESSTSSRAIDWTLYAFTAGGSQQPAMLHENVDGYWINKLSDDDWHDLEIRHILLPGMAGTLFEYRVDRVTLDFSSLRNEWYEFPAQGNVTFYFGDYLGKIPEGGSLELRSAIVDPISSCGSCR